MNGRPRDDRGAAAALVSVFLALVLIGIAAFALDTGMHRVARRDMQALADVVALDLARQLDGRTADEIRVGDEEHPTLAAALVESVERNDTTTIGEDAECGRSCVEAFLVDLDDQGGYPEDGSGRPIEVAGTVAPDGVVVIAQTDVDFVFGLAESGSAERRAVGTAASAACFRLGSFAARLDSSNSELLDDLVGDALDVTAIGYSGLADASITLAGLATELDVASPDGLVDLNALRLGDLYLAAADVLEREGGSAADVTLLRQIAAKVGDLQVDLADVLSMSSGGSAGLGAAINVLDLVAATAFAANGENALATEVIWNEPFISNGVVELRVIERPQLACGRKGDARAETAQVRLGATLPLHVPTILGLAASSTGIVLDAELAGASGTLADIRCGTPQGVSVLVKRDLVSLSLSVPIRLNGTMKLRLSDLGLNLGLLDLLGTGLGLNSLVEVSVDVQVDAGVSTYRAGDTSGTLADYDVPPHDWTDAEQVGDAVDAAVPSVSLTNTDVSGAASVTLPLLGKLDVALPRLGLVPQLTSKLIEPAINPLIANVNSLLTPTADLLGLSLGGADLFGVPFPQCAQPSLVG